MAPGADPTQIGWRYQGQVRTDVDVATGDLVITLPTPPGRRGAPATLREQAPMAWQDSGTRQVAVDARYTIGADGRIGFALGAYDRARPLVIDPALSYSTYLGGSAYDGSSSIATDRDNKRGLHPDAGRSGAAGVR